MTEQERLVNQQRLVDAFTSSKGVIIRREDGTTYNTRDGARLGFGFPTLDAAATHLFLIFHKMDLFSPEFCVINPKPSQPTGDFVFAADTYLWDEQKRMENMGYDEFLDFFTELVEERGVPIIGVSGGLRADHTIRVTLQVLLSEDSYAITDSYPALGSIVGGTRRENAKAKEKFLAKMEQAGEDFVNSYECGED